MKRLCSALLLLAAAAPSRAEECLWVLPDDPPRKTRGARVVFAEGPAPGKPELLKKLRGAGLYLRGPRRRLEAAEYVRGKGALRVEVPPGLYEVAGVLCTGVAADGRGRPVLVNHYAKTYVGLGPEEFPPQGFLAQWDRLALEVVPVLTRKGAFVQVVWRGRPVSGAWVMLVVPGRERPLEAQTDDRGLVRLLGALAGGTYGIRVRYTERRAGEYEGKKYREVRHHATMTFPVRAGR